MTKSPVRFVRLSTGVALATLLAASLGSSALAQAPTANPRVEFAQAHSDIAVDPQARFGRLPNGMTYVIYKNSTPPGAAFVRMRIAAGSIMEQADQQGLAHFIEHMAFAGSKSVAEGDMVKLLERDGLQFGADTNAQTSNYETVYMLNLPDAKEHVVDDALFLMRETAGNLTFNPAAINRERGAILGEERVRDNAGVQAGTAEALLELKGMKYPLRMPIGKVDAIKTVQRPTFVQFYNDFYRPEYTTLIVVGDVDPDRIESEIKRRFSDWAPGPQSPAALTDYGTLVTPTAPEANVYIADGLENEVSVNWITPPVDVVETKAKDFDDIRWWISNQILSQRFSRAAKLPDSNFSEAGLLRQNLAHTALIYALRVKPKKGKDAAALTQATTLLRQYFAYGPTQSELDKAVFLLNNFQTVVARGSRTRHSAAIAQDIQSAIGDQAVVQSAIQGLMEIQEFNPRLTLAAINALLKQIKIDSPPVLWRQDQRANTFDAPTMLATYREAMAAPLATYIARPSVNWPYTQFGTPSAVVSREELPDLGATRVTFANGVVLTVKPTRFEDQAVHVSVQVGNGALGIAREKSAAFFMARIEGLEAGGLGKLTSEDITEALTGKAFNLNFTIGASSSVLSGATTKTDLPVQMQVLTAYLNDPAFRPDALERLKASLPSSFEAARVTPEGVYQAKAGADLYGGDPRFATPSLKDALAVYNSDIKALVKDQLGHGPVEVTIVGDITVDEAVSQVGITIGTLPTRPAAASVQGVDQIHFPTQVLNRVYTHDGRADQNLSQIAWPTTGFYADPRAAAGLDVLAAIMTNRELEEVRKKQGATYSASVSSNTSREGLSFGFLMSSASVRPEADEGYVKTVAAIAEDLKQHPVTADELTRARLPIIDHLHNEKSGNGYWLNVLSGAMRDPRKIASAQAREGYLASITPEDIQHLAQKYLDMSKALHIQIKPKVSAPTAP